jgi:transposase
MRKLNIVEHLTNKELLKKMKSNKDDKLILKLTAIYMMQKDGLSCNQVGHQLGVSHDTVGRWVKRYNEGGEEGLIDKRKNNKRPNHLYTKDFLERVDKLLAGDCPYGGIWTGKKLQKWIKENYKVNLSISTIYRLIHKLGYSWKIPRPENKKADKEKQENFKKKLFEI